MPSTSTEQDRPTVQDRIAKQNTITEKTPTLEKTTHTEQDTILHKLSLATTWRTLIIFTIIPTLSVIFAGTTIYLIGKLNPESWQHNQIFRLLTILPSMAVPGLAALPVAGEFDKIHARLQAAGYHQRDPHRTTLAAWMSAIVLFVAWKLATGAKQLEWANASWSAFYVWCGMCWVIVVGGIFFLALGPVVYFSVRVEDDRDGDVKESVGV